MTKADMIAKIAEKKGLTKKQAEDAIDGFHEELAAMPVNESFIIRGTGTYKKTLRAARAGRNPQTGEAIAIPEKEVLTFKQSK